MYVRQSNFMKHFLLLLITLPFAQASIAQITYESPHVKDGKTIQLTIPAAYFEVMDMGSGNVMFATNEDVDLDVNDMGSLELAMITVMHLQLEGETLESMKSDLEDKTGIEEEEIIVLGAPEIVDVNGRECMYAGFDGDIIEEGVNRMYFSVIEFGDYFVMVNYFGSEKLADKEQLEYEKFKEIMLSWKEITTTKEDGMMTYDWDEDEFNHMGTTDEEFESNYKNDLVETGLSYYDVLPDFLDTWDEPFLENSHLLSEFQYKEDNGRIKVFSAGFSSNVLKEEMMADIIQLVTDCPNKLTLTFDSQFSNEDHLFKLYSISGGGTMTSVYTTIVNDEMVFFVIDGGSNPVDDFKPAVREFMLTMWVEDFDEELDELDGE